jgi:hypothetical protein
LVSGCGTGQGLKRTQRVLSSKPRKKLSMTSKAVTEIKTYLSLGGNMNTTKEPKTFKEFKDLLKAQYNKPVTVFKQWWSTVSLPDKTWGLVVDGKIVAYYDFSDAKNHNGLTSQYEIFSSENQETVQT